MPELPEVETIKLSLEKKILGLTIKDIQIVNAKSFLGDVEQIKGAKVVKVWRRAKVLGIDLSVISSGSERSLDSNKQKSTDSSGPLDHQNDRFLTLLFHLKMSGQVIFIGENRFVGGHPTKDMLGDLPNKHTRVIFEFEEPISSRHPELVSGSSKQKLPKPVRHDKYVSRLYFNDQRKFGWIKLVQTSELEKINHGYTNKLGPEPLEPEFTWEILKSLIMNHKSQPVKVAILDPSVVAGVGNIYACEACFIAKINPKFKVRDLSDEQIKKLHKAIVSSLQDGIKYGGSTKTHFVDSDGKKGLFLDYANVYNQVGKPCKVCGTKIVKIKLGGRGTFYCPKCQKGE